MMRMIEEARAGLKKHVADFPGVLVVLGSGLGGLVDEMEIETRLSYADIPHFPKPSVEGHAGELVVGRLGKTRVAVMKGRLHFYEGFSIQTVVFPYRVFARAGAHTVVLTNAAGGIVPGMKPPELVLLTDHINLTGANPLIGPNLEELGPRFPDMTETYDPKLRALFRQTAQSLGLPLREGVYVGITGPSYETPAEINAFRMMGASVVGMSTVPEAIALRHMGKRIVAISCVSNLAAGMTGELLHHQEVMDNAKKIYGGFSTLIKEALPRLEKN